MAQTITVTLTEREAEIVLRELNHAALGDHSNAIVSIINRAADKISRAMVAPAKACP